MAVWVAVEVELLTLAVADCRYRSSVHSVSIWKPPSGPLHHSAARFNEPLLEPHPATHKQPRLDPRQRNIRNKRARMGSTSIQWHTHRQSYGVREYAATNRKIRPPWPRTCTANCRLTGRVAPVGPHWTGPAEKSEHGRSTCPVTAATSALFTGEQTLILYMAPFRGCRNSRSGTTNGAAHQKP